jgi:oxaloacetate decarboxylase alpha subunit/pyruvate carboxylase subunit B
VGTQTVNNVLFDTKEERYKMITAQVKDLCYGLYGKTAIPIDPEVQKKALKGYERGETPITCKPAEVLKPELEDAKKIIGDLAVDDDDLILYTLFPVTGKKFLQIKYGKEAVPNSMKPITMEEVAARDELLRKAKAGLLVEKNTTQEAPEKTDALRTFNVFVEGEYFEVGVDEVGGAPVIAYAQPAPAAAPAPAPAPASTAPVLQAAGAPGLVPPPPPRAAAPKPAAPAAPAPAPSKPKPAAAAPAPAAGSGSGTPVKAPMPGMIIKYEKNVGDVVKKGDIVVILEAMKMENALPAPADGEITAINFGSGDSVPKDAVLALIG